MVERAAVFISYSHQDATWLQRLQVHLKPLERDHRIDIWVDTKLKPGSNWRLEIAKAIQKAKVAVLLVSADFLASDFIVSDELPPLLDAAENDGAVIFPIIVSPCRFARTKNLSKFQAVNSPTNPLIGMSIVEQEAIFDRISEEIEETLVSMPSYIGIETSAEPEADGLGGFFTNEGVRALVQSSGLLQPSDKVEKDLLIFSTSQQHTWLVSTRKQLFCLLDSEKTRKNGRVIQWVMDKSDANHIAAKEYKRTAGLLDISDRRKDWLYSTRLFPHPKGLEEHVRELLK